jgi:hypothetical protein
MRQYLRQISLALLLGLGAAIASPTVAKPASARPLTDAQKLEYKTIFDQRSRYADEHCVMKPKRFEELQYEICRIEDTTMKVAIEGPPGDNGPTAYFYGSDWMAFRDTASGQAWIFEKGKLVAEVEVGMTATRSKLRTVFNADERRAYSDRALSSTRNMLKVFGEQFRW